MKLFKNEVGRPSNEVLRKRKIVKISILASIIALITIIVGGVTLLLGKNNVNDLKGASSTKNTFTVKYNMNGLKVRENVKEQKIIYGKKTALKKFTPISSYYGNEYDQNYKIIGYAAQRDDGAWRYVNGTKTGWANTLNGNSYYKYLPGKEVSKTVKKGSFVTMDVSYVGIEVKNITSNSAELHWISKGKFASRASTYTIYKSDEKGSLGKKAGGIYFIKGYSGSVTMKGSNVIVPNSYYIASVKFSDGTVVNKWFSTKLSFTIKYDANGGTGTKKNQVITYGISTKLTKNVFTRSGYKFTGWRAKRSSDGYYLAQNGDDLKWFSKTKKESGYSWVLYKDQHSVKAVVEKGQTVTMIAQWKKNNSTTKNVTKKATTKTTTRANLNATTKTAKKATTKTTKKIAVTTVPKPSNKNAFLVVYNSNGGTGTMKNQEIVNGKQTKLTKLGFTNGSSKFEGWIVKRQKDGYFRGYNDSGKLGWYKYPVKYELYNDEEVVKQTVSKGQTVYMYAQWSNSSSKFVVNDVNDNCYSVTAPKDANYFRIHTYYKSASESYFGSNKISNLSYNHYNDGVKTRMICFEKQKYDSESYRLLVKVTTGANDKISGSISSWKPNGWSINSSIGWAYKDFNVNW